MIREMLVNALRWLKNVTNKNLGKYKQPSNNINLASKRQRRQNNIPKQHTPE